MGKMIYIIEDEPDIIDILETILSNAGYRIKSFLNGTGVFENEALPDLYLLDGWLGNIDGLQICRTLKANERTCHIPVILMSALNGIQALALECKADGFIAKPFQIKELVQKVDFYLNNEGLF